MLKIGDIEIKNRSVLAPLAGISDLPFRMINRRYGCELAFIEMISVHALNHRNAKTVKMLESHPDDKPLGMQILGRDHDTILQALDTIKPLGFDVLDFNSACPVKKVAKRGEGAALMKEPEVLQDILKLLVEEVAEVAYHDPFVAEFELEGVSWQSVPLSAERLAASDIVVITTNHQNVDYRLVVESAPRIVDTRNALKGYADPKITLI